MRSQYRKDPVLAHEQLHFGISEYWARRLTLEIRDLVGSGRESFLARQGLKLRIQEHYDQAVEEWNRMQSRYDGETHGGNKGKAQKRWVR